MDRKKRGLVLAACGIALLVLSFFILLSYADLYLASLALMFVSVVLIGLGTALARGIDSNIEEPRDECYFCSGTGRTKSGEETETCPRCGGTGLARSDD
ncbi:MAG: hypothetical protein ACXADS_07735 [Candidatus Thorarchaeota archaeon]|jgi:hypothetical protein